MKKIQNLLIMAFLFMSVMVLGQGVTSSSVSGKITDDTGEALPGANVLLVHTPSGTKYGSMTDFDGFYRMSNVRTGGPYKVTISYVGYQTIENDGIFLTLGQTKKINVSLNEDSNQLDEIVITAQRDGLIDGNKTGSETTIGKREIATMASASRSIADFVRLTPQTQITEGDDGFSISISGQNNRYNSIYIDGAVNNDVFGLAGSGTNGGQTGVSPLSIDAIESFQVNIAPFDVKQSGFTGGAINAITRSGTNNWEGSVYGFVRNQDLAGETPIDLVDNEDEREKLAEFNSLTYGARVAGPIVKDKLFFFVNYERQEDETPQPFNVSNYVGDTSPSVISSYFASEFDYDVGGFEDNIRTLESDKLTGKIDWNINNAHKLSLKHTYVKAENLEARNSNANQIGFINGSEFFESTTNTSSLEWSVQGDKFSNNLLLGYTSVRDDRDPFGDPFPSVSIVDGDGGFVLGAEPFSTANLLNTDIFTMTNNFEYYLGKHTFTLGIHNEFTSAKNLFFAFNYGSYEYESVDDFFNDEIDIFLRGYSLLTDSVGDESSGSANFNTTQLGYYIQDAIDITDDFKLTIGARFDFPIWEDGLENDDFNYRTIPLLIAERKELHGAKVGQGVNTTLNFSPRFGFNWDVNGKSKTQIRGGIGVFISRLPLVWPGGTYNNNGVTGGFTVQFGIPFNPDINTQPVGAIPGTGETGGGANIDLFVPDFKLPRVLKSNIAFDQKLPSGFSITADFVYNKNLQAIYYENLNIRNSTTRLNGADNRLIYNDSDEIDSEYGSIILASNTDQGYSWNTTFTLNKNFKSELFDLFSSASYSYGVSKSIFDGTSSQNSSQWRNIETVNGKNSEINLATSDFDPGHRVLANVSADFKWSENVKTTLGLFYSAQEGRPFSYIYGGQDLLNDDSRDNALFYVPNDISEINLVDSDDLTASQQWDLLDAFIEGNEYLSSRRGDYAERNGDRAKWSHSVDLKVLQDFSIKLGNKKHTLQASADIFNFTNLVNKDCGKRYFTNGTVNVADVVGGGGTADPSFEFDGEPTINQIDDLGIQSSRWQMQVGLRYIFQ